jgi:GT2 family glycosyltransferase
MTQVAVSVVIPAWNAADDVTTCLAGVLAQDYPDFEVIVVDDASSDKTPEVVRAHERVRLVRNPTNLGPAAARNRGVAESRGDLLVFIDSDSIVDDPRWLARHAVAHAAGADAVVGGGIRGIGRGLVARADSYCHWVTNIPHGAPTEITAEHRPFGRVTRHLVTNNMSVRRSTFDRVGGLDTRFRTGEDVDFCERALQLGIPLRLEPDIVVGHHDRERVGDFVRCFFDVGKDRIPLRQKNPSPLDWMLPQGFVSSFLLAPLLAPPLWLQTTLAWWPHDKRVLASAPLILLAYFAMSAGMIRFCYDRRGSS